jgi:hypothetical protein
MSTAMNHDFAARHRNFAPDFAAGKSAPVLPSVPRPWPRLARWIEKRRLPGDKGVGDTLSRMLAKVGGERFKFWYKAITGQECHCTDRQARLNAMYKYES